MRTVLFIIPSLEYGGAARQLVLLATHLPRERFQPRVVVLGREAPWVQTLRSAEVGVDVLNWWRPFDPIRFFTLRRLIRDCRPDVVHAWGPAALRAAALSPGPADAARVFVSAVLPPRGLPARLDRYLLHRKTVVALGASEAQRFLRLGLDPGRVAVVPRAVAAPSASSGGLPDVPPGAKVILCIGPVEAYKGFREAVWAMDILRHVDDNLHLVLAGTGPDRPRVVEFARAIGVTDHVHFVGPVADLGPLLGRADVVWVPSLADCGHGAALEAMSAGRPVVASRWPGLAEIVVEGETGFLVEPNNKAALARPTHALLEDAEARRRLGEAGWRRAAEHFSPTGLALACARLYDGGPGP